MGGCIGLDPRHIQRGVIFGRDVFGLGRQVQMRQGKRPEPDMRVIVGHPRDDHLPFEIDHAGLGRARAQRFGIGADGFDGIAGDRDRAALGCRGSVDPAVDQYQIGCLGHMRYDRHERTPERGFCDKANHRHPRYKVASERFWASECPGHTRQPTPHTSPRP